MRFLNRIPKIHEAALFFVVALSVLTSSCTSAPHAPCSAEFKNKEDAQDLRAERALMMEHAGAPHEGRLTR